MIIFFLWIWTVKAIGDCTSKYIFIKKFQGAIQLYNIISRQH